MKILLVDGPGRHPRTGARALGSGLHAKGHGVMVHPVQMKRLGWFRRHAMDRLAGDLVAAHEPDVVHVLSSEPWIADSFMGRGVSVVHTTFDRASKADWLIAPSPAALDHLRREEKGGAPSLVFLPYPIDIPEDIPGPGDYVLAHVGRRDRAARQWIEQASAMHRDIPIRFEGDPAEARFVISMSSTPELWPVGVAEAMAAARAVVAGWDGPASGFVLEGVTGFLSAPGDVKSLAGHLRYLWDQMDEVQQMGLAGREEARMHFGGEELVRSLLRWYLRAGVSRLAV